MGFLPRSDCVFLQKTSVAPAPSRDFYAIRVTDRQLFLCVWRISHGRRHLPHEIKESLEDFVEDQYMQDEIKGIFGMETVKSIMEIADGKKDYLPYLPMKILLKILSYLDLKDISHFAQVSRKCREVSLSNELWKQLFHKYNKWEITYEDRRKAITCGWKKLFMQKKLYLILRNEKKYNLSVRKPNSVGKGDKKPAKISNSMPEISKKALNFNTNLPSSNKISKSQLHIRGITSEMSSRSSETLQTFSAHKMKLLKQLPNIEINKIPVKSSNRNITVPKQIRLPQSTEMKVIKLSVKQTKPKKDETNFTKVKTPQCKTNYIPSEHENTKSCIDIMKTSKKMLKSKSIVSI